MSAHIYQDFMTLFRSILQRAIGPDKNFVKLQIKRHNRKEIKNEALKDALRELCSDEEYSDLDNWFPDKEDEKNEEKEVAFQAELKESLANLTCDDVMKALRKSLSTRKRCSRNGCDNFVINGGVCVRHGAKVAPRKRCSAEGCNNGAINGGVCTRHGAKRAKKRCSSEGCNNGAENGGVCVRHGAKVRQCSSEGCTKWAQNGGVCIRHGATWTKKRCSSEGCTNHAKNGGVCIRHGAKRRICSSEGCTNYVHKGGVCKRHKAKGKGQKRKRQDNDNESDDNNDEDYVCEVVEIAAREQRKIRKSKRNK